MAARHENGKRNLRAEAMVRAAETAGDDPTPQALSTNVLAGRAAVAIGCSGWAGQHGWDVLRATDPVEAMAQPDSQDPVTLTALTDVYNQRFPNDPITDPNIL